MFTTNGISAKLSIPKLLFLAENLKTNTLTSTPTVSPTLVGMGYCYRKGATPPSSPSFSSGGQLYALGR